MITYIELVSVNEWFYIFCRQLYSLFTNYHSPVTIYMNIVIGIFIFFMCCLLIAVHVDVFLTFKHLFSERKVLRRRQLCHQLSMVRRFG